MPLLMFMAMVGPLTLNVLQPAMPSVVRSYASTRETVQLTLSLYIFGMAVAQLIGGPLADRFGRRPIIFGGLTLYALTSLGAALAPSIHVLIVMRILQAIGATACLSLSRTIIGDLSDRQTTARMIAYVTMIMVIAPMAAPNIGALLDAMFGWRAIMLFCAVFGVIVLGTAWRFLFESRPASMAGATFSDVGRRTLRLALNPAFMRYAALSSFASACFFIFIGATPHLIIEAMNRPAKEYGMWFAVLGIGYALGNLTVARATHIFGPERMMLLGNLFLLTGIVTLGSLALMDVAHPAAVFLPTMLVTYGNGLVLPHSMALAIQTDRQAGGAASGLIGFSQMMVGSIGSYIVSRLPGETAVPMAAMMLCCGLIALLFSPPKKR